MKRNISYIATLCIMVMLISFNTSFAASKTAADSQDSASVSGTAVIEKIDINSADEQSLTSLPGVGPKMAERITDFRKANGPFQTVEDLLNVKGIGPKVLEKIKPYVKVS